MSEQRRATVVLIQRGDPEIAGSLMAGVMAGRSEAAERTATEVVRASRTSSVSAEGAATFPTGGRLWEDRGAVESVEIVTVQRDKWRQVARQVRVAVGNTKTPEDYRLMIVKARSEYAIRCRSGKLHTVAGKLLLAWALLWQGIRRAYRAQDRVLRP